jgi:uncharacterized protein YjbI with pentapeptide repeats
LQVNKSLILDGKDAILDFARKESKEKVIDNKDKLTNPNRHPESEEDIDVKDHEVRKFVFTEIGFRGRIVSVEFIECEFVDCEFEGIFGFFFLLTKCKFTNCFFRYSKFTHIQFGWDEVEFIKCTFQLVEIAEGALYNLNFEGCFIQSLRIIGIPFISNVDFTDCEIEDSDFQYINYSDDETAFVEDDEFFDITFNDCRIADTVFNSVELRNASVYNCVLYKCGFIVCRLSEATIVLDKELEYKSYVFADFQTIIKSVALPREILKAYFNIDQPIDLKKVLSELTTPIQFQTVFISYSLKDTLFANRVYQILKKNDVRAFLWEVDAPGGKPLKEIMASGIQRHERLLFIASENSIRSQACQFELSEGRRKQEALWRTILFPIYIDDYLFSVRKEDIRPIALANEYWENIEELKRVNALDFKVFNQDKVDDAGFEKAVLNLINYLKR